MTEASFDHAALRTYMAQHRLSEPRMAAHAGIPYRTLRGILVSERDPRPETRAAIERAMRNAPPHKPRKTPAHSEAIVRLWPDYWPVMIARHLGISKQRVHQIAHVLGLPPRPERRREITKEAGS